MLLDLFTLTKLNKEYLNHEANNYVIFSIHLLKQVFNK
jgi:hypothetical protein